MLPKKRDTISPPVSAPFNVLQPVCSYSEMFLSFTVRQLSYYSASSFAAKAAATHSLYEKLIDFSWTSSWSFSGSETLNPIDIVG